MKWLESVARPEIITLVPYSSARSEHSGGGVCEIQLDANENPWRPEGETVAVNRYPEPQSFLLKQALAKLYGVGHDQLIITRGADEGIDLLIRTFCRAGQDAVVVTPPTFGSYTVYANIQGAKVISVPLDQDDFSLNMSQMLSIENAKIVFICSPNNPTGSFVTSEVIEALCKAYEGRAIVAVDEAYIEFVGVPSTARLLSTYQNLVVLRTLSKAYALAGARIGSVLGAPEVIALLKKVIAPYPIPIFSSNAALNVLSADHRKLAEEKMQVIKAERDCLCEHLVESKEITKVFPSVTNFLLVIAKDADALYQKLQSQKIIPRNWNKVIPRALRITVGSPQDNKALLCALGLS